MMRGAIIGLGNVGFDVHLPAWMRRDDVEIVAVADVDPTRGAAVAARHPRIRWYDSADALLSWEPLDFVDICTPPASHVPLIQTALTKGLHVLCEKPLVRSRDELAQVTQLTTETGRVVHTVHNWHHAPIVRRVHELLQSGAIGQITAAVWQTLRTKPAGTADPANWRLDEKVAGGGVLSDHGWHVFYLLCSWIGEPPTSVSARLETRRHTTAAVEDTATVRVAFPHATAEIFLTWAADQRDNVATLIATEGRIELHDDTVVLRRGDHERRFVCPPGLSQGSVHPDWFDPVLSQFVGEATGSLPRDSNLSEAWLCTMLESGARESSQRGGRAVTLPRRSALAS
jgi:predicted dehydrogenase